MLQRWLPAVWVLLTGLGILQAQDRSRLEIPLREGGSAVIEADVIDRDAGLWMAQGEVVIRYKDITVLAHRVFYDPVSKDATLESKDDPSEYNVEVKRAVEWLKARRGEINLERDTGTFFDVDGFTEEDLFVKAASITKTGPDTYVARNGIITACDEAVPKWSFHTSKANIRVNSWVRSRNTAMRIKKVPVFYLPYFLFPSGKKERQSGFLLPSTGNSSNKGRRLSQSFYLTLGRSADLVYNQDYFSERGFGYGFVFRFRPNQVSRLVLDGYAVNDRLDQGGASLNGEGETRFGGFRAVSVFNLVSSFEFRQVFSDNFFAATRPTELSQLFISRSDGTRSFNFLASREETAFPGPNAVVRAFPQIHFRLSGQPIFDSPFFVDLDVSAAGLNRSDNLFETPGITQRLDLFPRFYFSLPLGQGLRLTPKVGLRATFYSDSFDTDSEEGRVRSSSDNVSREYADFSLDLRGWGLSKIYRGKSGQPRFKHLIEPSLRYRHITGIDDDFFRTLRFDELDAIADTNEVEVALHNRFFVKRGGQTWEWLSIKLAQKYFFDADFGGALQDGRVNQFFPLYTFTGFQYAAFARNSSPITTVVRFTPRPSISFDLRTDYDPDFDRFRNVSLTGVLNYRRLYLGTTYFNTQQLEAGTFRRNQLQQQVAYGDISNGLSLSGLYSYDLQSTRFLNFRARINYFKGCCGVSVQFQGFNLSGIREERQVLFSFYFKGLGYFGNIEHPDRVF